MIGIAGGGVGRRAGELLAARGLSVRTVEDDPSGIGTLLIEGVAAPPGERERWEKSLLSAAKGAGVGHVVYLSLQGAAPDSSSPASREAWRGERLLQNAGLPWTILRMGLLAEELLGWIGEDGVVRGPAEDGKVAWIAAEDATRAVAAALVEPPGGVFEPTGPEALSMSETMAVLSSVVDRWLSYAEETEVLSRGRAILKGVEEWRAERMAGAYKAIAHREYADVTEDFRRLTGALATPFWRWALGNPLLDRWHPSLEVAEEDVRATIEDLGWIEELDDPAIQDHLAVLARQFEGTDGTPELIEAFLALYERFPDSAPDLEGNATALFMLSLMPAVGPLLLRSLDTRSSAVGTALLIRMLANEDVFVAGVDLRAVLQGISQDRTAPARAHREAVEWLEDPHIDAWLRVPGTTIPDGPR